MSFPDDIPNKMMTHPPAKKGWHFPSDGFHFAEFIETETIEEATATYHRIKRLISGPAADTATTRAVSASEPEQSTPAAPIEPDNHEL